MSGINNSGYGGMVCYTGSGDAGSQTRADEKAQPFPGSGRAREELQDFLAQNLGKQAQGFSRTGQVEQGKKGAGHTARLLGAWAALLRDVLKLLQIDDAWILGDGCRLFLEGRGRELAECPSTWLLLTSSPQEGHWPTGECM